MTSSGDPSGVPESELDALFAAPLDEFVNVRKEIAKRLAGEGRRAEADAVRALRKPTVPVWAVNQLARERKADISALVDATSRLRRIHAGAGGGDFSAGTSELQSALDRLVAAAGPVLGRAGRPSDELLRRVAQALRAAAVADADGLRRGTLTEAPEAAGFDVLLAAVRRGRPARKPGSGAELAKANEDVRSARATLQERRRASRDAERREAEARKDWERARAESERAAADVAGAETALAEAERRAKALRSR